MTSTRRPRARLWTLSALDRDQAYELVFNHQDSRWDLYLGSQLVVTRDLGGTPLASPDGSGSSPGS